MIRVTAVGTIGTRPRQDRFLSSLHVLVEGHSILIDCGENTQVACMKWKVHLNSIEMLLLTHVHLDHVAGLPGILTTMEANGRTTGLQIVCPVGAKERVISLMREAQRLSFPVRVWELHDSATMDFGFCTVEAVGCKHSVPCNGYVIQVPRRPLLAIDRLTECQIPMENWTHIQAENFYDAEAHSEFIRERRDGFKLVYVTDTVRTNRVVDAVRGADLAVLEGYCCDGETQLSHGFLYHLTAEEAARVASEAGAKEIWLTHYGVSKYAPCEMAEKAARIHRGVFFAFDGLTREFTFERANEYSVVGEVSVDTTRAMNLLKVWQCTLLVDVSLYYQVGEMLRVKNPIFSDRYREVIARVEHVFCQKFADRNYKILGLRLYGFQKKES